MAQEITAIIPKEAQGIALTQKGAIALRSVGEAAGFASLMASSGMLPKNTTPEFATIAIVAGAPLGLNPFESVQSIAVINGRPSLYGDGMKAVVQGSGVWESEQVEWFTNSQKQRVACRVTVRRKGNPTPIVGEFSESMARKAGLWGKTGPWTQYPERMLLARARAFAYRDGFADILKGVRSAEEELDIIDSESPALPAAQPEQPKRKRRASASEILAEPAPLPPEKEPEPIPAEEPQTETVEAELIPPDESIPVPDGADYLS